MRHRDVSGPPGRADETPRERGGNDRAPSIADVAALPWHRGRQTHGIVSRLGVGTVGGPCALIREMPHAMTVAEIDEMVRRAQPGIPQNPTS